MFVMLCQYIAGELELEQLHSGLCASMCVYLWFADVRHIKGNPKSHVGYAAVSANGKLFEQTVCSAPSLHQRTFTYCSFTVVLTGYFRYLQCYLTDISFNARYSQINNSDRRLTLVYQLLLLRHRVSTSLSFSLLTLMSLLIIPLRIYIFLITNRPGSSGRRGSYWRIAASLFCPL